jgi:putrescine aminotransferase
MVVDEVITGFGRLGTRFGIDRWKVVPDMLVFAKSVTSGYLPLGGVVLRESVYRSLLEAGPSFALHHGFTYSGHPVVCAAALANLDILEREQLVQRARKLAPYFARRLATLRKHSLVGDVRTVGLMGAVELVRDRDTKEPVPPEWTLRIRRSALDAGVIVRASGNMIVVCPPLIVGREEIDRLVNALDDALGALQAE